LDIHKHFSALRQAASALVARPDLALARSTLTATGFRDGDVNLHYVHVNREKKGRSCRACHDIHAGNDNKLMREPYAACRNSAGDRWIITDDGDTPLVVWLDNDVMLVATSMRAINRALDAREGVSLLDEAAFNEVVAELPADRLVTVYVGSQFFEALTDLTLSVTGQPSEIEGIATLEAMGIGFTLRDDGVQWDLAQVRDTAEAVPAFEPPPGAISHLPPETLGYVAFTIPEGFVDETVIEALQSADPDTFEALTDDAEVAEGLRDQQHQQH